MAVTMRRRTRLVWMGCIFLAMLGLSIACGVISPGQSVTESTVAAVQSQVAASALAVPTATPVAAPGWRAQLIGLSYPPLPVGWESVGGAITFSTCDPSAPRCSAGDETYDVAHWRQTNPAAETAEELLLFGKQLGYDLEGQPIWTVLDVLVGSEAGGTNWLWGGCRMGDSPAVDDEIVALYSIITDPSSPAWRANHLTGRFESISTQGLICVDENAVD